MEEAAGLRSAKGSIADMARKERRETPEEPEEFVISECYDETGPISFTFGKVKGSTRG